MLSFIVPVLLYDVPSNTKSERFCYTMCLLRMCLIPTSLKVAVQDRGITPLIDAEFNADSNGVIDFAQKLLQLHLKGFDL